MDEGVNSRGHSCVSDRICFRVGKSGGALVGIFNLGNGWWDRYLGDPEALCS